MFMPQTTCSKVDFFFLNTYYILENTYKSTSYVGFRKPPSTLFLSFYEIKHLSVLKNKQRDRQ